MAKNRKQWMWCVHLETTKGQRVQTGQRLNKSTALSDADIAMRDPGVELVILQRMERKRPDPGLSLKSALS